MVVATAMLVTVVLIGGCTSGSDPSSTTVGDPSSTTTTDAYGCVSAPEDLRHSYSEFPLSLDDNPVDAGGTTTIRIGSMVTFDRDQAAEPVDWGIAGFGARWECWTGSEWVNTHLLVYGGGTVGGDPSVTTTWLDIGRPLPDAYQIIIPNVRAGWYRLVAEAARSGQNTDSGIGYIAVEVVE